MLSSSGGLGPTIQKLYLEITDKFGYGKRIFFDAEFSSHIFHYSSGYRAVNPLDNERIENELCIAHDRKDRGEIKSFKEHSTSHLGGIKMYLPNGNSGIYGNPDDKRILHDLPDEIILSGIPQVPASALGLN